MDSTWVVVLIVLGVVVLVATIAVVIVLLVRLIRMASVVRSDQLPVRGKVAYWAAIVYTIVPVDLLPDPVLFDDIGVLAGAIAYVGQLARKYGVTGARSARMPIDSRLR